MTRVGWDEFFMEQALIFSKRATCKRLKVGVIITDKDNLQLAEGYNGSIKGHPHCEDEGCLLNDEGRCIRTVHAEQNGILNAMKKKVSIEGGRAYVTHEPCENCMKLLIQSGISEIIFLKGYKNKYNHNFTMYGNVLLKEYDGANKSRLLSIEEEINRKDK